jgi:hypothetical protein
MREIILLIMAAFAAFVVAAACGGGSSKPTATPAPTLNPADFSATIDNPLFPMSSLGPKVFEGDEKDPDTGESVHTRIEHTILPDTEVIGGVAALVLQDKEYQDGNLIEIALDYFAQHRDGSVWYLGERVDEYENGQVTGHSGQWLSGDGANRAGIYMPARPTAGQEFSQENAPGIAEDVSKVIAVDLSITVPAGSFAGCLKAEDTSPLDNAPGEFKYYCPAVGLVREEPPGGRVDLISYN